jgi:type II secretory pathway component HofQ
VENGDTAVIGGVFQGTVATSRDGIPLLGRIPLLGYLFASTQIRDTSSEIFIFLTAKIMNAEESFKRTL